MITSEVYIGPPTPQRGLFASRTHQPSREPREPTRYSEDGPRLFDDVIGCWVAVLPVKDEPPIPPPAPRPVGDGSGRFWLVVEDGQVLWEIEARDFRVALDEKRRLCQLSGGKSGWARLVGN